MKPRVQIILGVILGLAVISASHGSTATNVYELVSKSTVIVFGHDASGAESSQGSGVAIPGGAIATNCHVIDGAVKVSIRHEGELHSALLHHADWDRDICTLTLSGLEIPPVRLGASETLKHGSTVYAVGAPRGLELTISDGIISALREFGTGQYIQTTAPISPGSSGGGLYDKEGRLLGLTTFQFVDGQNLNFAVPVEWILELPYRHSERSQMANLLNQWRNESIALIFDGKWKEGVAHAERWAEAMPDNPWPKVYLGKAYQMGEEYAKAIEAYTQATQIDPDNLDANYQLGVVAMLYGWTAVAINGFRNAAKLAPDRAYIWRSLSVALLESGQFPQDALETAMRATRLDTDDAISWAHLGRVYSKQSFHQEAIQSFQASIAINPNDASVLTSLGLAYHAHGMASSDMRPIHHAIEYFLQAIRVDPNYVQASVSLGMAYGAAGRKAEALKLYESITIDETDPRDWISIGLGYYMLGEQQGAINAFLRAIQLDSDNSTAWLHLGLSYLEANRTSDVMEVHRKLREIDPARAAQLNQAIMVHP